MYRIIDTGSDGGGIAGGLLSVPEGASYVTFYVRVGSLEGAAARAQELGANIRVPPREVAPGL